MAYKVLITGGSGFIGTNILKTFEQAGHRLLNVDVEPPRCASQEHLWQCLDILSADELTAAVQEFAPDYVLHLAARTDMDGKTLADYDANTWGVRNVIAAVRATPSIRRTIFMSSRLVCQIGYMPTSDTDYNATTVYGQSKVEGEKIVRTEAAGHFPWLIMRPTSIWGPWFDVPYRNFFDALRRGIYIHPAMRRALKSYGYVGNSVYQIETMLTKATDADVLNKTFYMCDYPPLEVREWTELICRNLSVRNAPSLPYSFMKLLALSGDLLKACGWLSVPLTSFRLNNILTEMVHETSDLEKLCGQLPFRLEDGVRETCDWLRQHPR